jgi:hypothetical protein
MPVARHRIPDDEVKASGPAGFPVIWGEERAAVAAVNDNPLRPVVLSRAEGGGGDEDGLAVRFPCKVCKESQQERCSVELAVAATEAMVGDDAAPWPADEGGADKVCWLVRW